jgi:sugar/nucleoside kinase (ribokinase family)
MTKTQILIFGGIIVDQYALVNKSPDRGGDVLITDSFFRVGGCAINVGSTLQNLGLNPHIVSSVGDDAWGQLIRTYLKERQFSELAIRYSDNSKSGYCISIIENDGERTFLTYKGCEADFTLQMLDGIPFNQISHIYVTGYYLLQPEFANEIVKQLKKLKEAGAFLIFDPGPLVASIQKETLHAVLELANILIPNEGELDILERTMVWGCRDLSRYWEKGIEYVVLKKGSRGVHVFTEDSSFSLDSFQVNSIDTTGAGDSFAAGLLYGLSQGYDMTTSTRIACACGAITTTFMGPHGIFTYDHITEMIEKAR